MKFLDDVKDIHDITFHDFTQRCGYLICIAWSTRQNWKKINRAEWETKTAMRRGRLHQFKRSSGSPWHTARCVTRVWINEGRVEAKALRGSRNKGRQRNVGGDYADRSWEHFQKNLSTKPIIHTSTITCHTDSQLISLKIAGKDSDVPDQRNLPTNKKIYQY